jgi:mono/diheme cytochrome c family protein
VTNRRKTKSFQGLCLGFGAIVCALACGADEKEAPSDAPATGVDSDPTKDVTEVPSTGGQLSPACDDSPLVTGCPDAPDPAPRLSAREQAQQAAEAVLATNCSGCHGSALPLARAQGGINFIDDIDALIAAKKLTPLNSATSPLIQLLLNGEMPPPGAAPAVSKADVQAISSFIDNPRFWPDYVPVASCKPDDAKLVDFDELFQSIEADLSRADADDRVFLRYVSLTNRLTTACGVGLDGERQALSKMLNMLSIKATVEQPEPIDRDQLVYRIDLRDFEWDRAVSVNGTNFADVWEAIAANNPYAVEFAGDDADEVKADAATDLPVMFADQMLDVATIGNLYYAIINVDVAQPLGDFIQNGLGIDVAQDILDGEVIRAGTTRSRISRQDRLVERHDIQVRSGALWQSFDFANDANESIFEDPFGFDAGGSEVLFTLPNGMLGYIIADADDNIVQDSDILLDSSQDNFRAVTAVSCSNCHAQGVLPVEDEVAAIALANSREIGLDRDEVELLQEIYVSPKLFADQAKQDSDGFYRRALGQANLPTAGSDPVATVFLRFEDDLELAPAAGDLGVSAAELEDSLNLLDPVLGVLRRGTLDRDDFTALFVASLCELSTTLENRPDAAACELAEAALDD